VRIFDPLHKQIFLLFAISGAANAIRTTVHISAQELSPACIDALTQHPGYLVSLVGIILFKLGPEGWAAQKAVREICTSDPLNALSARIFSAGNIPINTPALYYSYDWL